MKIKIRKYFSITLAIAVITFIVCILTGAFGIQVPELIKSSRKTYRFLKGCNLFFNIFPVVCATGFLIGLSLDFGKDSEGSLVRFSNKMFERYKSVMTGGIFAVLLCSLFVQAFSPIVNSKIQQISELPDLKNDYRRFAETLMEQGRYPLAGKYAELALKIDSSDPDVKKLYDNAEMSARKEQLSGAGNDKIDYRKIFPQVVQEEIDRQIKERSSYTGKDDTSVVEGEKYTPFKLLKVAEGCYSREDWFGAHYYSQLAISISTERDINIGKMKELSALAWNKLSTAQEGKPDADQKIFRRKLEGYSALMGGDNLKAYYIFKTLSGESKKNETDPDIRRYLALAQSQVENQYFFTDETFNLQSFERFRNVYFKILKSDGSTDIYFIKGVTSAGEKGDIVQYLRGLSIFTVSPEGKYVSGSYTAYAKMMRISASVLDQESRDFYGINEKTRFVPYLMLSSIDRNKPGMMNNPVIKKGIEASTDSGFIILPFEYSQFELLKDASDGLTGMNLTSEFQFLDIAENFGYPREVFWQAFMNRLLYPIFLLILVIGIGILGWHGRIPPYEEFKFGWIVVVPVYFFIFYMSYDILYSVYKIVNNSLLSIVNESIGLLIALIFYILCLLGISIKFLSCKNSMAD